MAFGRDLCRTVLVSPRRAHSREDHGFRDGSRRGALIPRSGETCSQALHLGPPAFPALVQSAHKIAESLSAVAQNGSLSDRKARHLNLQVRSSARGILLAARSQQSGGGHGFLTLENNTEVFYQMSEFYYPELARGVRWNDPAFNIAWPAAVQVISDRDRTYPDLEHLQCV